MLKERVLGCFLFSGLFRGSGCLVSRGPLPRSKGIGTQNRNLHSQYSTDLSVIVVLQSFQGFMSTCKLQHTH